MGKSCIRQLSVIFWGSRTQTFITEIEDDLYEFWAIYNDLSRGHPKWWFSKGIPPKMALN